MLTLSLAAFSTRPANYHFFIISNQGLSIFTQIQAKYGAITTLPQSPTIDN
jgi:hypothetical protein